LQRWLRHAGLTPPPALLVRRPDQSRAGEPHQVWQMDAVERLKLLDGSGACWLRISDEFSGAILLTEVFGHSRWSEVPAAQTQEALRVAFARYGLPGAVRVDNGIPWGIPGGLPSGLGLWLAGLGVTMHWNDPHSPKQNAVVERTQGVSQRWAAPGRCADLQDLRARLHREDHVQREEYPAVGGVSRKQAYPMLCNSGRGYARGCEALVWELSGALGLLARYQVRRKVSKRGQVSVYHRQIEVGSQHGGCFVYVGLDARTAEWVISEAQGRELRRRPAPELTQQTLQNVRLSGS
jgi:hypothetical protein